ncbi:hypothetical protein MYX82_02670 [Acidobacteria bacterium AH-259-D05]|nr:hypothetical protein [Acidobacteria bacterium AH-259-D05]
MMVFLLVGRFALSPFIYITAAVAIVVGSVFTAVSIGYKEQVVKVFSFLGERVPPTLFYALFVTLFIASMVSVAVFLLFPEKVVTMQSDQPPDKQIFGCIVSAGLLGGLLRQVNANRQLLDVFEIVRERENPDQRVSYFARFWKSLIAVLGSTVVSLVLFLLLRAGVLKSVEVDTFNVYGVTGVAVITGYFAENVIQRLTVVYEQLVGTR